MKIHSIFESISGEAGPVIPQGAWTTFVRTQGCPLRCEYCDTGDAQDPDGGVEMSVNEIMASCHTQNVLVTGGEPFSQPGIHNLLPLLHHSGHVVQVETNGSYWPVPAISGIGYAIDIKCPCSGMGSRMLSPGACANGVGLGCVLSKIDLKFVIRDAEDVQFAMGYVKEVSLQVPNVRFVFSPLDAGKDAGPDLINEIVRNFRNISPALTDRLIISLQMHKILQMP